MFGLDVHLFNIIQSMLFILQQLPGGEKNNSRPETSIHDSRTAVQYHPWCSSVCGYWQTVWRSLCWWKRIQHNPWRAGELTSSSQNLIMPNAKKNKVLLRSVFSACAYLMYAGKLDGALLKQINMKSRVYNTTHSRIRGLRWVSKQTECIRQVRAAPSWCHVFEKDPYTTISSWKTLYNIRPWTHITAFRIPWSLMHPNFLADQRTSVQNILLWCT